MIPGISQSCTMPAPMADDLAAFGRHGFGAVELWLTKLESALQGQPWEAIRDQLVEGGFRAIAATGQGGLLAPPGPGRELHLEQYRRRLELLEKIGAGVVILSADPGEFQAEHYGAAIASLREAATLAGDRGLRLALEFHRGSKCCGSLDTAMALIAQADAPNLGVCLDVFHYYNGPSKYEDLAYLTPENLAWVQVSDVGGVPREQAADGDRVLPGDGDYQLAPIIDHLRRIGYEGPVSLELLNPQLWRVPPEQLAALGRAAIDRLLAPPPAPEG